jgi:catalase
VDAVVVPGGDLSALSQSGDARYYLLEAYKHLKPILLAGDARQLTSVLQVPAQGEEGSSSPMLSTRQRRTNCSP